MSSQDRDQKMAEVGLKSYDAAATAIAQSLANSAQDQVDLIRNQNIVKTTVMASAYAKWLENPVMKDEFKAVIDDATVSEPKSPFTMANDVLSNFRKFTFGNKS